MVVVPEVLSPDSNRGGRARRRTKRGKAHAIVASPRARADGEALVR